VTEGSKVSGLNFGAEQSISCVAGCRFNVIMMQYTLRLIMVIVGQPCLEFSFNFFFVRICTKNLNPVI